MHLKRHFFIVIALIFFQEIQAQDNSHFTLFDMSPSTLNPAMTGGFSGTFRVNGIYRGQWASTGGYKVPSFSIDAPVITGFRKTDWVGVGISFLSASSNGPLKDSGGGIALAYHFGLNKKQTNVFSIGLQYGSFSRGLNTGSCADGYSFRSCLTSNMLDPSIGGISGGQEGPSNGYSDFSIGFRYASIIDKENQVEMGLSLFHFLSPNNSIVSPNNNVGNPNPDPNNPPVTNPIRSRDNVDPEVVGFLKYTTYLSKRLRLEPRFMVQAASGNLKTMIQGMGGYLIDPKKSVVLNGGLGLDLIQGNAVSLLLGAEIKDLRVGFAYDFNFGQLAGDGLQNNFELGVSYVVKIFKEPNVDPVIFCPRF